MSEWASGRLPDGVTHRLLLVRHGEPVADARGRCYGRLDVGLSATGVSQAARCAAALRDFEVDRVVASPRIRTRDTARPIAAVLGCAVEQDPDLQELDFGAFEGKTHAEAEVLDPDTYAAWMATPTEVRFPGGETHGDLHARVSRATARVRRAGCVALVTHAGVIRTLLADYLGMAQANQFRLHQDYAHWSCVDFFDDTPVVRAINRS